MSATAALATLRTAGFTVTADGGELIIRPGSRLTPDLLALARNNKPGMLALLRPWTSALPQRYDGLIPPGVCADCGGAAPANGMHWCAACEAKGANV
ncbi:MAG: hypothetical protein ACJ8FV_00075 [Xanthobacteraceae bacterium]